MSRAYTAPTRIKDSSGKEVGAYRAYHPGLKKRISLGTKDYNEACKLQAEMLARFEGGQSQVAPKPSRVPLAPSAPEVAAVSDDKPLDPADLLNSWAGVKDKPAAEPVQAEQIPIPEFSTQPAQSVAQPSPAAMVRKQGLSPEQSQKMAVGLKKLVTNLNVIVVGWGIQMFGKDPAPLDEEELELLQLGWELWLDEIFVKRKPKPWMLVAVGNLMIAVAMYMNGKPREVEAQADPHSAPGNAGGADGN
jgi:hypothetical protein